MKMESGLNLKNLLMVKPKRERVEESPEIKKWIDRFREEREFDGIKESTIKSDILRLRVFLDFVYNRLNKTPETMANADFVRFFNYLEKERKVGRSSQDKYFKLLKVFYRLMRLDNFKGFAEESKERRRFSKFEIKHYDAIDANTLNLILEKMMESNSRMSIRNCLIVRLLWDTGARISEVLNLRYRDCDFDEGTFRITNTKNSEERVVVCSSDTLEALRWYVQFNPRQSPDDYIFQTPKGERVSKDTIYKVFRKAVDELKKEGKIPKNKRIVLHSLRHGRAVDLLDKGVPIDIVKEYLGHRSLDTTLYYSHSKERALKMLKTIKKLL